MITTTCTGRQLARRLLFSALWLAISLVALHWALKTRSGVIEVVCGICLALNVLGFYTHVHDWKHPGLLVAQLEEFARKRRSG